MPIPIDQASPDSNGSVSVRYSSAYAPRVTKADGVKFRAHFCWIDRLTSLGGYGEICDDINLSCLFDHKHPVGFLAFHDHRLERSHDIERLVEIAKTYEAGFAALEDAAITLTPYATAYRYPGESATLQPDRREFEQAFELEEKFVNFVLALCRTSTAFFRTGVGKEEFVTSVLTPCQSLLDSHSLIRVHGF